MVLGALREALAATVAPTAPIEVMPNGVHAERFENLDAARGRRRRELGLGEEDFALGFLQGWELFPLHAGPLAERLLEELMGRLSGRPVKLVSIGGGTQLEAVRARMQADPRVGGRVIFAGQVPHEEVPQFLGRL